MTTIGGPIFTGKMDMNIENNLDSQQDENGLDSPSVRIPSEPRVLELQEQSIMFTERPDRGDEDKLSVLFARMTALEGTVNSHRDLETKLEARLRLLESTNQEI